MCQNKIRNLLQLASNEPQADAASALLHRTGLIASAVSTLTVKQTPPKGGSRRRRLWELSDHAHCPVVGACLPMSFVRKLVVKVHGQARQDLDDYDCHCTAVTESKRRTPLAELIQRELDQRCAQAIREAAHIRCEDDLVRWWRSKVEGPQLAQAFWVTLTHPFCSNSVEYKVLGHVHMLQHQIGTLHRVERAQFEALLRENEVLGRHLASAQDRMTRMTGETATKIDELDREVLRLRAEVMTRDTEVAALKEQIAQWQATDPDLPARRMLARRQGELMSENQTLRKDLMRSREEARHLEGLLQKLHQPEHNADAITAEPCGAPQTDLGNRAILCVGGRAAIVPIYRELIEQEGGRFLHHDGGEEHSSSQLDATLAAADLVICQTGCVSHNAYWRVKDHCKRTGKQCVFVDTPSRSALSRALTDVAQTLAQHSHNEPDHTVVGR